jgi:hypothetical protein
MRIEVAINEPVWVEKPLRIEINLPEDTPINDFSNMSDEDMLNDLSYDNYLMVYTGSESREEYEDYLDRQFNR